MKRLIMILVLCGCSTEIERISYDPEFSVYINQLREYCIQYHNSNCDKINYISVSFKEELYSKDKTTMYSGCCLNKEITINRAIWNEVIETEKELLILHEYGHCAFGLKDLYNNPESDGIMYYSMPGKAEPFYIKDKDKYLKQYFGENNGN